MQKITTPHRYKLARLAIPRLTYNNKILDVIVYGLSKIKENAQLVPDMMYVKKLVVLPHFSAMFKPKSAFNLIEV